MTCHDCKAPATHGSRCERHRKMQIARMRRMRGVLDSRAFVYRCGACKRPGHNAATCPAPGTP